MGLAQVVRSGVATANKVTKDLQPAVTYERYLSTDGYGERLYAASVSLRAIVDWKTSNVNTKQGEMTVAHSSVTFLDVVALTAVTGGLGLDDNDRITLPDGTTGPIVALSGFVDAGTGRPFATEAYLG